MEYLATKHGKIPVPLVTVFVMQIQVDFWSPSYPNRPNKRLRIIHPTLHARTLKGEKMY